MYEMGEGGVDVSGYARPSLHYTHPLLTLYISSMN